MHTPYNDEAVQMPEYPVPTPPVPPTPTVYSFGGLEISPAPMYYNGEKYVMKDSDWNHNSYNSVYGENNGSYYFEFADIDSSKLELNGWRIPTNEELATIITTDSQVRPGSTVNNNENKHYSFVRLDNGDSSYTFGLIIFPDEETITGATLSAFDETLVTMDGEQFAEKVEAMTISTSDLSAYLDQGCVFIPAFGEYIYNSQPGLSGWKGINYSSNDMCDAVYGYSSVDDPISTLRFSLLADSETVYLKVETDSDPTSEYAGETICYAPVRLVKSIL